MQDRAQKVITYHINQSVNKYWDSSLNAYLSFASFVVWAVLVD